MIEASVSLRFAETLLRGRALSRAEVRTVEPLVAEMVEFIRDRWPVGDHDGVHSRDLWRYRLTRNPPAIWLINDADYAQHVHRAGDPTLLEDSLVPAALNRYGPEIRRVLSDAIMAANRQQSTRAVVEQPGPRRELRSQLRRNLRRLGVQV